MKVYACFITFLSVIAASGYGPFKYLSTLVSKWGPVVPGVQYAFRCANSYPRYWLIDPVKGTISTLKDSRYLNVVTEGRFARSLILTTIEEDDQIPDTMRFDVIDTGFINENGEKEIRIRSRAMPNIFLDAGSFQFASLKMMPGKASLQQIFTQPKTVQLASHPPEIPERMAEDDPVVREHRVFLTTQMSQYLHLIQAPSRDHMPNSNGGVISGRFKKNAKIFELDVPMDTNHQTYSQERGSELGSAVSTGAIKLVGSGTGSSSKMLDSITLSGGPVTNLNASYFAAVFKDDDIYLTPINSMIQLRPSLTYLDEIDAKTKATTKKLNEADRPAAAEETKAVQIQFKKKETDEQIAARLNSFAYLKRQVDDEPWIKLSHFSKESQEAEKVMERLVMEGTENVGALEFEQRPDNYLDLFL